MGLLAVSLIVVVLTSAVVATGAAAARLAGVAIPIAFALYRLAREPSDRFAALLLGSGAMWSLTVLAEADDDVLYSIGRLSDWLVEPVLVYLILSFPSGRL